AQIWTKADSARFSKVLGGTGPRATPTIFGGRLYTLGAMGALNCRDLLTGKRYWKRNILADAQAKKNLAWGMSGSPLVVGNLVFVNAGKGGGKAVIAYHRLTGKIVWATGNEPASYSTPVLARIHGMPQLLVFNGIGLFAYDPNSGRELWKYDKFTNSEKINVAQPIVRGSRIFISSGYSAGSALLEVSVDAGKWSVRKVWNKNRFRLKFNDGVYKSETSNGRETGYVYGLDETILTCIEFDTGEIKWRKRGKFGYGQLLLIGDVLLVSTEKTGEVVLFRATPTRPTELTRFRALDRHVGLLQEKGSGWNHPVITDGLLLIRNDREAACYDLRKRP
ncbi:MAG: PQQ-like beta-propeller repeat protein, partial [Planctomycetes bacterium]|nr:PQQ-like beta-propeller repeat protein [Planctomycetota bacterium]